MKRRAVQPRKTDENEYKITYREKALRERRRKQRQRRRLHLLAGMAAFCVIIALSTAIVVLSMIKTDLSDQVSELQARVDILDSEYTSLKAQEQSTMTLSEIEDYAENELGLVRLDSSQEEYISVEKPDQIEVKSGSSGMDKLVSNFVKSFNAILSFLR